MKKMTTKKYLSAWDITGIVVLILVGFWLITGLPNGSAKSAPNDQIQILLTTDPNPPQPGKALFTIDVRDAAGKPIDDAKVSFDLNMTTMDMGRQSGDAKPQGNGQYAASAYFSMRGPWRISTEVKEAAGSTATKEFILDVR